MAVTVTNPPEQGQLVSVRSRQRIVNDVRPGTLPAVAHKPTVTGPHHLLTQASVEDDGLGEELQVIWEIEPGAKVIEKVTLPEPTGFDPPDKLAEGLLVPLRQVGVRLLQFHQVQGTDRLRGVVGLRGRVPMGHQLVEFVQDDLRRVPATVPALLGLRVMLPSEG
jgi:hypothetical protein